MDAGDPQSVASALTSMLNYAAQQARQAPNSLLQNLFNELPNLTDRSSALPDDAITALRQHCDPPQWSSLLTYIMLRIEKPLRPSIWIGAAQPTGWAPMLTLNYSPDAQLGVPPTPPVLTIGLAVTDPTQKQGVWVNISAPFTHDISYPPALRLAASLSSSGTATWQYPFGGQPSAVAASNVSAQASVSWTPHWPSEKTPVYALSLGGLSASVVLQAVEPIYQLQVGFGPLRGTLTPEGALGEGLASRLPHIGDISVRYTPSVVIKHGAPPSLTLGS